MIENRSAGSRGLYRNPVSLMVGAGAAIALLAFSVAVTARSIQALRNNAQQVASTYQTIVSLNSVLSLTKDAETGQRGFIITGDASYLAPYRQALTNIDAAIGNANQMLENSPEQQARMGKLQAALESKLTELAQTIALRQTAGFEAAQRLVLTNQGKQKMEEVRAIIDEMSQSEQGLLERRSRQAIRTYQTALLTSILSGLVALAALIAFLTALTKYLTARDRAALIISEQAENLQTTLASIGDAVITTDAQGAVANLNPVAESLTGWTNHAAIGQPLEHIFQIVNETTRQPVANPAAKALVEGTIVGLANHTVLIAQDGSEKPIDDSAAPIRTAAGIIVGCVLVFRDVSERRSQENQLRDERERLELALSAASLGQWDLNLITGVANRTLRHDQIFGYDSMLPEWTYDLFLSHVVERDRPAVDQTFQQAINSGGKWNIDCQIRRADGSMRWIEIKGTVHPNAIGQNERMLGVVSDITVKQQAEEDLRTSEQRFRQIADTMPQIVWVTRPDGYHEYYNRRWYEYTGLTPEESIGLSWNLPLHPEDKQSSIDRWNYSLRTGEPYEIEYRFRSQAGSYRWFLGRALPVKDDTGKITRWFGTCTDIDDTKRIEAERQRLAADLAEASRRKDEFLATLAHELRNPLAPIRNGLQILKLTSQRSQLSGPINTAASQAATERIQAMMERQLAQMVRLIDELMDISRISRGKVELRREQIEIAAVIEQAVEASRPAIEQAGQTLTVTLPPHPIYLRADLVRLVQVFSNLLNNAGKYSEPGSEISLTVAPESPLETPSETPLEEAKEKAKKRAGSEAEVVISVKDTGVGIAADMLPKIFELFTQVKGAFEQASGQAAALSQGGLGIGLTLVKQLVEMHGGSVSARSEGLGQGSEFVVRLPTVAQQQQAIENNSSEPQPMNTRRILIVDDNEDSAMTLSMLFEMTGDETQTAHDGLKAVKTAETFRPDVALLDIGLPGLSGYEVARQIRTQPWGQAMVLVALTGWGQAEDRQRSQAAGFDAHMVKPID
ncbi:MAG: PAS domain S-box protein, partial [Phormidesmis sp.]